MAGNAGRTDRDVLAAIARQAMIDRRMEPDFPPAALQELDGIQSPAGPSPGCRDLRTLLWSSIDNDDSLDLDQLTVAKPLERGRTGILVAIADVDALVHAGSAIDGHALRNTTSVYTPAMVFTMLPTRLSTNLTSLNEDEDRRAIVVDMTFDEDGALVASELYGAQVRNGAKLAYNSLAEWLSGQAEAPARVRSIDGLAGNLRLQDAVAQSLAARRHTLGALSLDTIEARAVFSGDALSRLDLDRKNRAKELIEDFMIAANGVTATFLASKGFPSLRRVLRSPDRWDRIVRLAAGLGGRLPEAPDGAALESFLVRRRRASPDTFADLSLALVKLMGRGEYTVDLPGGTAPGHFGLAVKDYSHSTAPNRRFPDLITQRLLKAAMSGRPPPYSPPELVDLARHCTDREDDAAKVERRVSKSAAALLLAGRCGESFDAIVTGASPKGTWVRVFRPPVDGRLDGGPQALDVGDRIRVKLYSTDVAQGFINFVPA